MEGAAELLAQHGQPDELVVRDVDIKGFVVRLRASGRHVYGVKYGRAFLTLGRADILTAGKARKAAREDLAQRALSEDGEPDRAKRRRARLTLKAYLDEHYEPWALQNLRTGAETVERLRVQFGDLLDTRLVDLSAFAVERFRTARLRDGKKRATVNRDVVTLKAALSRAVAWGHLTAQPLATVKPYKVDSGAVVRYLTRDEETRLFKALDDRDKERREARQRANAWRAARNYELLPALDAYTDHLTPLVQLALHTGLRRGELFGIRWRDVDLVRAILTVRGEGAKSGLTRHVPLNSTALETLRSWMPNDAPESNGTVFTGDDGSPLEDVKKGWSAILRAAEIRHFRFHDLRHTFASNLVQAGVDLNTVRELLGHRDIKMTLRYAHLAPETKAGAVAKLVRP